MTQQLSPPMERLDPTEKELSTEDLLALCAKFPIPYSDEYEMGVLSGCLHDPERLDEVQATVKPQAFHHFKNRMVYQTILAIREKAIPLDIVSLTQKLRELKLLDKVGGPGAISELYTFLPASSHYDFYVTGLLEKYSLRQMIRACLLNINAAANAGSDYVESDVNQILDDSEVRVRGVRDGVAVGEFMTTPAWMDEMLGEIENRVEKARTLTLDGPLIPGTPTGLDALDERTGGLCPGHTWLVQAGTSDGKTAFALQLSLDLVLRHNPVPVTYYLTESQPKNFWDRCYAHMTGIPLPRILNGDLSDGEVNRIAIAASQLRSAPFILRAKAGIQKRELLADMRLVHRRYGKIIRDRDGRVSRREMVFAIDFLQRVRGKQKNQAVHEHIEATSAEIADLTTELQATSLILAQVNADNTTRGSQSPAMDADLLLMISCPPAVDPATGKLCVKTDRHGNEKISKKDEDKRRISFGKNRMGKRGGDALTFNFNGATQTFS